MHAAIDYVDCIDRLSETHDMASITIRNLEEAVKARLRIRAAQHGRSMEEEARHILRAAVGDHPEPTNLADLAGALFGSRGVDLEAHPPIPVRDPPDLGS